MINIIKSFGSYMNENRLEACAAFSPVVLAAGALCVPWEAARIVGLSVLTGSGYGIANNMLSLDAADFFTEDLKFHGNDLSKRLINTLNPHINAVVLGIWDSLGISLVAGAVFATVSSGYFPQVALTFTAVQVLPYIAVGMPVVLAISHVVANLFYNIAKSILKENEKFVIEAIKKKVKNLNDQVFAETEADKTYLQDFAEKKNGKWEIDEEKLKKKLIPEYPGVPKQLMPPFSAFVARSFVGFTAWSIAMVAIVALGYYNSNYTTMA